MRVTPEAAAQLRNLLQHESSRAKIRFFGVKDLGITEIGIVIDEEILPTDITIQCQNVPIVMDQTLYKTLFKGATLSYINLDGKEAFLLTPADKSQRPVVIPFRNMTDVKEK